MAQRAEGNNNNLSVDVGEEGEGEGEDAFDGGQVSPLRNTAGNRSGAFGADGQTSPAPGTPGAPPSEPSTPTGGTGGEGGASTPSAAGEGSAKGARRKHVTKYQQRKLKEEKRIKISLYINGTAYEFGKSA